MTECEGALENKPEGDLFAQRHAARLPPLSLVNVESQSPCYLETYEPLVEKPWKTNPEGGKLLLDQGYYLDGGGGLYI